jgi:uncharacterized protein (TIGR02001 family)
VSSNFTNKGLNMNKTAPLAALALTVLAAPLARAEVSSTITLATDYDFRGISQTARDPALQASLDWSSESGFYLGAWVSNVDFGPGTKADFEWDLLGGYRGSIGEDGGFDIGFVQYNFNPSGDKVQFGEFYAGASYKAVSGKLWYADDFSNSGKSATYIEVNAAIPLPNDFGLALHVGQSDGDYWDAVYDGGYLDYSIGVTKSVGNFALALKWIDGSDLKATDGTPGDVFTSEGKVQFSVATTLPW